MNIFPINRSNERFVQFIDDAMRQFIPLMFKILDLGCEGSQIVRRIAHHGLENFGGLENINGHLPKNFEELLIFFK